MLLKVLKMITTSPLIKVYYIPLLLRCRTSQQRCLFISTFLLNITCVDKLLEWNLGGRIWRYHKWLRYLWLLIISIICAFPNNLFFFFFKKLGVLSSSLLLKLIKYITTPVCCFVYHHSFSRSTFPGNTTTSNPGSPTAREAAALLISLFGNTRELSWQAPFILVGLQPVIKIYEAYSCYVSNSSAGTWKQNVLLGS